MSSVGAASAATIVRTPVQNPPVPNKDNDTQAASAASATDTSTTSATTAATAAAAAAAAQAAQQSADRQVSVNAGSSAHLDISV